MIVKVCGMREPENLTQLLQLPVDWIGFIFYPPSRRYVDEGRLSTWIKSNESLFEGKKKVGVFVNAQMDELLRAVHAFDLDMLQLHGEEQPDYLADLSRFRALGSLRDMEVIKAFRLGPDFDFSQVEAHQPFCQYFLFDTLGKERGGTGQSFDWSLLEGYTYDTPFILSGGIGPQSLPALNGFSHPVWAGIDLNSQFELEPGRKNVERLDTFLQELKTNNVV